MRCSNVWWCLFLALCLIGWLAPPERAADEVEPPPATFDRVVLTSSGGFTGRGSGKALTLAADGKLTAKTRNKQRQGELKPEELTQLRKLVMAVDWKGVKQRYQGRGADFFQDDLAVTVAGKTYESHVSEEVNRKELPPDLRELLAYLDQLHTRYRP